jgi:hypothetical protein
LVLVRNHYTPPGVVKANLGARLTICWAANSGVVQPRHMPQRLTRRRRELLDRRPDGPGCENTRRALSGAGPSHIPRRLTRTVSGGRWQERRPGSLRPKGFRRPGRGEPARYPRGERLTNASAVASSVPNCENQTVACDHRNCVVITKATGRAPAQPEPDLPHLSA